MKKILSILAALFLFTNLGFSQQAYATANLVSLDSGLTAPHVANTGVVTMYTKVQNAWDVASIQLVETKVSGTVAGTAVLVGSNDGVNFVDISRPSILAVANTTKAYNDTLTSTNVTTNTRIWTLTNKADATGNTPVCFPYQYLGIKKTGSGTMNSIIKAYAVFKHK